MGDLFDGLLTSARSDSCSLAGSMPGGLLLPRLHSADSEDLTRAPSPDVDETPVVAGSKGALVASLVVQHPPTTTPTPPPPPPPATTLVGDRLVVLESQGVPSYSDHPLWGRQAVVYAPGIPPSAVRHFVFFLHVPRLLTS